MKLIYGSGIAMLMLMCGLTSLVQAQRLKTGDSFTGYLSARIGGHDSSVRRLSELKGKIILLDFWNIYCSACIGSFPKLDSLQEQFKEQVQIVLVNRESAEKTAIFFNKYQHLTKPRVQMVMGDSLLHALFPSDGLPYVVWIDEQGIVKNFSNGSNVSKRNLEYFIEGKPLLFRDPTLERYGSVVEESLFDYASLISHCYEKINIGNSEIHSINGGKSVSVKSNCSSIVALFLKAYNAFGRNQFATSYGFRLEVMDRFKYEVPSNLEDLDYWLTKHAYNYQLILPAGKQSQAYSIMQQDLARYFEMDVKIERIPIEGLVIFDDSCEVKGTVQMLASRAEEDFKTIVPDSDSVYVFDEVPAQQFVNWLKVRLEYFVPVVNKVRGNKTVSLRIRKSSLRPLKLDQLAIDLKRSGLGCMSERLLSDVLYIREKKY